MAARVMVAVEAPAFGKRLSRAASSASILTCSAACAGVGAPGGALSAAVAVAGAAPLVTTRLGLGSVFGAVTTISGIGVVAPAPDAAGAGDGELCGAGTALG